MGSLHLPKEKAPQEAAGPGSACRHKCSAPPRSRGPTLLTCVHNLSETHGLTPGLHPDSSQVPSVNALKSGPWKGLRPPGVTVPSQLLPTPEATLSRLDGASLHPLLPAPNILQTGCVSHAICWPEARYLHSCS